MGLLSRFTGRSDSKPVFSPGSQGSSAVQVIRTGVPDKVKVDFFNNLILKSKAHKASEELIKACKAIGLNANDNMVGIISIYHRETCQNLYDFDTSEEALAFVERLTLNEDGTYALDGESA